MDVRKLRYFCTIAVEGSFGKAAEKLFVAQPALSRQIGELEKEVGAILFHRLSTGVSLTAAGEVFLKHTRRILADIDNARIGAQQAAQGAIGALNVGLVEYLSWHRSVVQALRDFCAAHHEVALNISTRETSLAVINNLIAGRFDCGFAFNRPADDVRLSGIGVFETGFQVAVPAQSQLASRRTVKMQELANEPFILIARDAAPAHYDRCITLCRTAGFEPRIAEIAGTANAQLSLVAAGTGCAIVTSASELWKPENVRMLGLSDVPLKIDLEFVWRTDSQLPALNNFIDMLRRKKIKTTLHK
jgi:DNA-binding transcriptional LysR family regulator